LPVPEDVPGYAMIRLTAAMSVDILHSLSYITKLVFASRGADNEYLLSQTN